MPITNSSAVTEFILLGLTDRTQLQPLLFVLFLLAYLVTMLGNLGRVVLSTLDSRLHTPMYFLTHLALVDLCYTYNATLTMLTNFLSDKKTISFAGCFIVLHFYCPSAHGDLHRLQWPITTTWPSVTLCATLPRCLDGFISLAALPYAYGFLDGLL